MWEVVAKGSEGRVYTYLVDAPDYAPEGAVWESASRQHGQERRDRNIRETLSIRPSDYKITLVCPQGSWRECQEIINKAADHGYRLAPADIIWTDGQPTVDGMDPADWLSSVTAD